VFEPHTVVWEKDIMRSQFSAFALNHPIVDDRPAAALLR
jgi:hypothetical protein